MNINEFQDENNIVDPNVRRKQGSQEISKQPAPNQPRTKRIVTPQEMGFTHEEVKKERPEQPILDNLDKAIARKQREAILMANAIDEADEEGLREDEFQDLLEQAKDELDADAVIPTEEEFNNKEKENGNKAKQETSLPETNPAVNLMDELDAEIEQDEADYAQENPDPDTNFVEAYADATEAYYNEEETSAEPAKPKVVNIDDKPKTKKIEKEDEVVNNDNQVMTDDPFKDFVSGDINFDKEDEELDENIDEQKAAEKEQQDNVEKLRKLIRQKISPVTKGLDISTFTISKRPASTKVATPRSNKEKIADWVLMSSHKPIYMRRFTGTEIERLANGGKGRTRLNRAMDTWQLIYDHIMDPNKPDSLEKWAKITSFLDIDHIYMAIYRANFDGSNYLPYNCTNSNCKEKVILTDNIDIMDMCKFSSKEAKDKFFSILGSETSEASSKLYNTEVVPVSDDYAFVFREPSIYNIIFESAMLDQDFVDKFGDLVTISTYIDGIYYINRETRELQPVRTNFYPNNMKKTVKSRIINYSKIVSTLNSDQYNTLLAYMQKINEAGDELKYQMPEITCPTCGTVIPASEQEAQSLVFTRHQLAALANF